MEKVVILSSCNEWNEYASASIIGVFSDINKLRESVYLLFEEDRIEWMDTSVKDLEEDEILDIYTAIMSASPSEIDNKATYIMIEEYNLNELY